MQGRNTKIQHYLVIIINDINVKRNKNVTIKLKATTNIFIKDQVFNTFYLNNLKLKQNGKFR